MVFKSMSSSDQAPKELDEAVKHRLLILTLIPLGLIAAIFWNMGRDPEVGPEAGFKNLLLVTFDTTRADALGCYGNSAASTVNLDRMAKNGVLLERCFSTAPITLPSHTSILTGNQPFRHGARNNGTHFVPEEAVTMAEVLSEDGFATGAVISAFVLDSRFGLDQGFDSYDDDLTNAAKAPMFMFRETTAEETARRALEFLKTRGNERWFLWVHFFDPHANYDPPEEIAKLCPNSPYDGEIAYADSGLGDMLGLLTQRGMLDETLVMMTSDHGEAFGDHGETTHGIFIYDSTTHVPWIAMHPGLAQGKRVREVVSGVDLFPTAMELLGVETDVLVDGKSLARELLVETAKPEPSFAYSESMNPLYNHGWSDLRSIRDDQYRYIKAPTEELYDVMRDFRQSKNIFEERADLAENSRGILEHLLSVGEVDVRGDDIRSMDPEARAALAALGYVWSEEGELSLDESNLADPKDRVHAWEKAQFANQLVRLGQIDEAELALREVLAEDPGSTLPRSALVGVLMQQEKFEEALELQRESVLLPGVRTASWVRLAELERKLENDGWEAHLERAKIHDPKDPLPWVKQGDFAADDDDAEAAIGFYREALKVDERCAKAWVGIGNTKHKALDEEAAAEAFKTAAALDPVAIEAHYNLGVIYESMKKPGLAERAYKAALRVDGNHVLTLVNIGNVYERVGKAELAEGYYRRALSQDPSDYSAVFNLGLCLRRQGKLEDSAGLFRHASTLKPEAIEPLLLGAGSFRQAEMYEPARVMSMKALELNEESLPALLQTAALSHLLDEDEVAASYLERAVELEPERVNERAGKDEALKWWLETR
jgi:arylsulfatase A-like enzyme/Tfp pilus assembly protein PilF